MKVRSFLTGTLLSVAAFVLAWFVADGILGWSGLPMEAKVPAFYPANLSRSIPWVDKNYVLRTNSQGIRYDEIPFTKPLEEKRVAVVGDSMVEGQGVDAEQTFCHLLEREFSADGRKVRFINCGIAGAGPLEYAEMLYRIALKYQPDHVVIMTYANDFIDTPVLDRTQPHWRSDVFLNASRLTPPRRTLNRLLHDLFPRTYTMLKRISLSRPRFLRSGVVGPIAERARKKGVEESKIADWRSKLTPQTLRLISEGRMSEQMISEPLIYPGHWADALDLTAPEAEEKWATMSGLLEKMISVCRDRGIPVALSYAPHPYQYDPRYHDLPQKLGLVVDRSWMTEETQLQRRLREFTERQRVPYLDLTADLRGGGSGDGLNFRTDPHMNADGHRLIASVLSRWFREIWPDLLAEVFP